MMSRVCGPHEASQPIPTVAIHFPLSDAVRLRTILPSQIEFVQRFQFHFSSHGSADSPRGPCMQANDQGSPRVLTDELGSQT